MKQKNTLTKIIPPGILIIFLAFIYLSTIAPDISWANNGSDGGDLITASATGGIAHPSGYPLYMLLARLFQLLPISTLAFRTNLMSATFAVITAWLVYALVTRYLQKEIDIFVSTLAGLCAGFVIGLSPLFWSQAVITEVYTLHAFFIMLIIILTVQTAKTQSQQIRIDRWRGIIYGLATGNHLTVLFIIPAAIAISLLKLRSSILKNSVKKWGISVGRQLSWMLAGLIVYAMLPLRAMKQPIINWGNPINLENFWWLISAKIYRAYYLHDVLVQLWPRIQASASLLIEQIGLIGITFGFVGLVVFFSVSKLYALTIWNGFIFWIISISYQSTDAFVYFIPTIISFSIWIGLCLGYGLEYLKRHSFSWGWLLFCVLVLNIFFGVVSNWQDTDASQDFRAKEFVNKIFTVAPKNAIVFTDGDQAVFTLWYFHFALEQRSDLVILAIDLLHYDWYQNSMKKAYPGFDIPGSFPWPSTVIKANPSRDVCYVQYNFETEIHCMKPNNY